MPEKKNGGMALRVRPPAFGLPTGCPRCLPSFLYLRLAGAAFRVDYSVNIPDSDDLPVCELGLLAGFSSEPGGVEEFLRQEGICDIDADVAELEKPDMLAFKSMVLKLQDAVDLEIWLPDNEAIAAEIYTSRLPWPLSKAIEWFMRRKVMERLGITKENFNHTTEEIYRGAFSAYTALAARKSSETFFLREKPTSLDAYLLAHLLFVLKVPFQSKLRDELHSKPQLVNYAMRDESFLVHSDPTPHSSSSRATSSRGSTSASSSRRSNKGPNPEPKREPTPKEKEFRRKGKMFLGAQLAALAGFLLFFGLDSDYEDS